MLNNFIYAQTKDLFLEQLNAGNILDEAIVFIEDTKEIWNHGHYFAGDCGFNQDVFNQLSDTIKNQGQDITVLKGYFTNGKATSAVSADTATDATNATNLKNNPSIQTYSGNTNQITITAGGKTSSQFTVPYATTSGSASEADSAKAVNWTAVSGRPTKLSDLTNDQNFTANTGTVTNVATGTGLTGGPITGSGTISLATSGVAANSYGPSANSTPTHSGNFSVPYITVDKYGRVTGASTKTITLPGTGNVQSDWNATSGDAFIKNKPTIPTYSAGTGISLSGTTFSHADTSTLSGSYGPTADVSGSDGATIVIPQITVDSYGHVTGITNRTYTSVDSNSDTKVKCTLGTTTKYYLAGTTKTTTNTGGLTFDTGIYSGTTAGYLYAKSFYETSDARCKNFIGDIDVDFDKLKLIPKKYFTWKDSKNKDWQIGTSAQEVQKIFPELVSEDDKLHVDYSKLSIIALAAIDKLYEENKELKERVNNLENTIKHVGYVK